MVQFSTATMAIRIISECTSAYSDTLPTLPIDALGEIPKCLVVLFF